MARAAADPVEARPERRGRRVLLGLLEARHGVVPRDAAVDLDAQVDERRAVLRRLDDDRLVRDLDLAAVDLLDGLVELALAARFFDLRRGTVRRRVDGVSSPPRAPLNGEPRVRVGSMASRAFERSETDAGAAPRAPRASQTRRRRRSAGSTVNRATY